MNEIQLYHPYGFIISPLYTYVRYGIGFTACAIALGIVAYALKKWYPKRVVHPWQHALRSLQALEQNTTVDQKEWYFAVSGVIKHYCAQRFVYSYESLSDKELIQTLVKTQACSPELCKHLETVFNAMHMIKFYTHTQQEDHKNLILEQIRFFINTTIPT